MEPPTRGHCQGISGCTWSGTCVTDTPTPAPNNQGECPFVTLDFTDLPNPLADHYGQAPSFQGGDYLYDQLWWSHGVKVSARILYDTYKYDSMPFIPKFIPGLGWIDAKMDQSSNDPSSGGALSLFDTMHPAYNSNPAYNQPSCLNKAGEGDPDLGAPNEQCAGGGPGTYVRTEKTASWLRPFMFLIIIILLQWSYRLRLHRCRCRCRCMAGDLQV